MKNTKNAFTLLEVLTVVVIIGILSALGYSSLMDLIQTNKAKDTARTMTAFTERMLAEAKMKKKEVTIELNNNEITATITDEDPIKYSLNNGFSKNTGSCSGGVNPGNITAQVKVGISGVEEGCLSACVGGNTNNYCGSALKESDQNRFKPWIKRRGGNWEAL